MKKNPDVVHSQFYSADWGEGGGGVSGGVGGDCAQQSDCTASEAAKSRTSAAQALDFLPIFHLPQLTLSSFNSATWKDFSLLCNTWGFCCVYFIIYPLIICDALTLGNISSRAFSWDSLTQFPYHLSSPGCAAVSCLYHHRWPLHQNVGDVIFVGFSHIPLTQPISNDFTFWFTPLLLKKKYGSSSFNFLHVGI